MWEHLFPGIDSLSSPSQDSSATLSLASVISAFVVAITAADAVVAIDLDACTTSTTVIAADCHRTHRCSPHPHLLRRHAATAANDTSAASFTIASGDHTCALDLNHPYTLRRHPRSHPVREACYYSKSNCAQLGTLRRRISHPRLRR